jgi:hypothetical protein
MKISKIALLAVPTAVLLSTTVQGASLTVSNPSFETLPAGGLPTTCGTGCAYDVGAITGWTNGGSTGQFQTGAPTNTTYMNTRSSDGTATIAYDDSGTISQTVVDTVQTNVVYTLMVDLGVRIGLPFTGSADLLINGHTITATGTTPTSGNWSTFTATYTGLAADAGDAITIELKSSGAQAEFDDVRLSSNAAAPTPEPASLTLVGLSLAALVQRLRRKRTA